MTYQETGWWCPNDLCCIFQAVFGNAYLLMFEISVNENHLDSCFLTDFQLLWPADIHWDKKRDLSGWCFFHSPLEPEDPTQVYITLQHKLCFLRHLAKGSVMVLLCCYVVKLVQAWWERGNDTVHDTLSSHTMQCKCAWTVWDLTNEKTIFIIRHY